MILEDAHGFFELGVLGQERLKEAGQFHLLLGLSIALVAHGDDLVGLDLR